MITLKYHKFQARFIALSLFVIPSVVAAERNISDSKFLSGLWKIEESAPIVNPIIYLAITRGNVGIRYSYTEETTGGLDYCYVTERFEIKELDNDKFQFVMTESQEALNSFTAIRDKSTITMTSEKRVTFLEFVAEAEPAFIPCDEKLYVSLIGGGHRWSMSLPVDTPEPEWSDDTSDIAGTWFFERHQRITISIINDTGGFTGVFLSNPLNRKIECGAVVVTNVRHDGNGTYIFSDDSMLANLVLQKANDQLHFKQPANIPGYSAAAIVAVAKEYKYPNNQLPDCL